MFVYAVAATAGFVFGSSILIGRYRRHRVRAPVYQVVMAQHLWRPRKLK